MLTERIKSIDADITKVHGKWPQFRVVEVIDGKDRVFNFRTETDYDFNDAVTVFSRNIAPDEIGKYRKAVEQRVEAELTRFLDARLG